MSLIQMSISGAIMILAVIVIRALAINRLPKKTFVALWGIVLLRLLLPFFPSPFSAYSLVNNHVPATQVVAGLGNANIFTATPVRLPTTGSIINDKSLPQSNASSSSYAIKERDRRFFACPFLVRRFASGDYQSKKVLLPHLQKSELVKEKNLIYHEVYALPIIEAVPEGYNEVTLVCLRQDGAYEAPSTVSHMCTAMKKRIDGFENFHFHLFRHTYTSKLLAKGAAPKDVHELLGHTDINTTMNIYAHATRESKRNSVMLLEKVTA